MARAIEKREARRARKHAKANRTESDPDILDPDMLDAADEITDGEEREEPEETAH